MSGSVADNEEEISGINVTPLVDIMLVLLIIFMVTATFVAQKALDLKLPEAESSQPLKPDEKIMNFAIDREGRLYANNKEVNFDEIAPMIKSEREAKPGVNLAANIVADGQTPYATIVKLIDIVRKNEIIDFAISTDPVGQAPAAP